MPDYLVEAYQTASGAPDVTPRGDVRLVQSIFVPQDEIGLHLFAATSAAAVREALVAVAFAYERIVEASTA